MKAPLFIRAVTAEEQQALQDGLRAADAFTLRRCQILLASQQDLRAQQIAERVLCDDDTVRKVIQAFNDRGVAALTKRSSRRHHRPSAFRPEAATALIALIHQRPRIFGHATSLWTLPLLAKVAFAQGLTTRVVAGPSMRAFLLQHGIAWKRAKHWITSPDPAYAQKNAAATG
jgi:transposase